jgi:hypothetical protein
MQIRLSMVQLLIHSEKENGGLRRIRVMLQVERMCMCVQE